MIENPFVVDVVENECPMLKPISTITAALELLKGDRNETV